MLPNDEYEFLQFACNSLSIVALTPTSHQPDLPIIQNPLVNLHSNTRLREVLLWNTTIPLQEEDYRKSFLHEYDAAKGAYEETRNAQYSIEIFSAPVIQLNRSFIRSDGLLAKGRIWAEMYRLVEDKYVHKGKEFEQWYNSIARWLRRNLKRVDEIDGYFGADALTWYKEGGQLIM
jgi:hypothetical protein